jgi:hypothetical protein
VADAVLEEFARNVWFGESGPLCEQLAALADKWRTDAAVYPGSSSTLRLCADELEAVLRREYRPADDTRRPVAG